MNIPDDGGNFVDNRVREFDCAFPICKSALAPYVFGGGGRQNSAGLGMEWPRRRGDGNMLQPGDGGLR